jgi:hypothetical protein
VSPRGSAPRLELLRRRRVAIPLGFGGFWLRLEIAGNDSVYCEGAMMRTRSDWRSEVVGCAGQIISIAPASGVIKFPFSVSLVTCQAGVTSGSSAPAQLSAFSRLNRVGDGSQSDGRQLDYIGLNETSHCLNLLLLFYFL